MVTRFRVWMALGLLLLGSSAVISLRAEEGAGPAPSMSPSSVASPVPSHSPAAALPVAPVHSARPSPKPSVSTAPALTPADAKSLQKEYEKAQRSELKALQHRQKLELTELRASQGARLKEWLAKEKEGIHRFTQTHKGAEVRAFIREFEERYKAMRKILEDERTQRTHEQEVHFKSLQAEQASRAKEFQDDLKKGVRPPGKLWPDSSGR